MIKRFLYYKDEYLEYYIVRKKVKNINLRITKDLKITVSANKAISEDIVHKFVISKGDWIEKSLNRIRKKLIEKEDIKAKEKYRYLGKCYTKRQMKELIGFNSDSGFSNELEMWYKKNAAEYFNTIIGKQLKKFYAFRLEYPKVTIRKMKTRWGSCNKKLNKINLNQELIKQPVEAIEYVVTHELAHLVYANHGESFYELLGRIMPDYQKRRLMLDDRLL